jgi:hypothetical protein
MIFFVLEEDREYYETLHANIGKNLQEQGLSVGMMDEMEDLQKAVGKIVDAMTEAMEIAESSTLAGVCMGLDKQRAA